jgi:hypothetical protein
MRGATLSWRLQANERVAEMDAIFRKSGSQIDIGAGTHKRDQSTISCRHVRRRVKLN